MITTGIVVVILVILGIILIAFYNGMVRGKNLVEEAWSGILVQLKRRHDLIPALVNTVKAYTKHETETLVKVTEARAKAISMGNAGVENVEDVIKAENNLMQALRSIFAVAENYPELKANENFLNLQQNLAELEDEIQMARRYYNGSARMQNDKVLQFPGNILARQFGFSKITYFELENEEEMKMPQVQF